MRQVLQARGEALDQVVFPLHGVASMISMGESGESVEVATIGYEGMVGLPLFLGGERAAVEVFMQVPAKVCSCRAAAFQAHMKREPSLLRILLLYTQALLTQIAQCSACNCYHLVEARCARWMLQTQDRVKGDEFPLTQEFLGLMLGVRRASVTETANALQERGLNSVSPRRGYRAEPQGTRSCGVRVLQTHRQGIRQTAGSARRRAAA